jgi:DNA (cytosine-5)-methyltransferase 1
VPLSSRDVVAVQEVVDAVDAHFGSHTASRLPVIAVYSAYQLLIQHVGRYAGKQLADLLSHTTADRRTHNVGDVQVLGADGAFWEAVEVKHLIAITPDLVLDAYLKIQDTPVTRYYLLTTAQPPTAQQTEVDDATALCRAEHGCEMIVNGVLPTLQYYLRLLPRAYDFLTTYTENLNAEYRASTVIKEQHLESWQEIQEGWMPRQNS